MQTIDAELCEMRNYKLQNATYFLKTSNYIYLHLNNKIN